jgi:acyl carrier protein
MATLTLVSLVEEEFHIRVTASDLLGLTSFSDILSSIRERL